MEAGLLRTSSGPSPTTPRRCASAGAVGIQPGGFDDSNREVLCERIAATSAGASRARRGPLRQRPAATCTSRRSPPRPAARGVHLPRTEYKEAGADGSSFRDVDPAVIRRSFAAVQLPLNVLVRSGFLASPSSPRSAFAESSAGSGISSAVHGLTPARSDSSLRHGPYDAMLDGAMPYPEVNALFTSAREHDRIAPPSVGVVRVGARDREVPPCRATRARRNAWIELARGRPAAAIAGTGGRAPGPDPGSTRRTGPFSRCIPGAIPRDRSPGVFSTRRRTRPNPVGLTGSRSSPWRSSGSALARSKRFDGTPVSRPQAGPPDGGR
jgi:hypothetical protein